MSPIFGEEEFNNALKLYLSEECKNSKGLYTRNFLHESLLECGACKINVTICLEHHSQGCDCRQISIAL